MTERKAGEVENWLARAPASARVVLFFGPDRGLVSERAKAFLNATGLPADDAFTVVRMEGDALESDPGLLEGEANTISMFSPERLVWVRNAGAGKGVGEAVRRVLEIALDQTRILIEAGDLKKTAPLRAIVASSDRAVGLPCYADEGRTLDSLIDQVLGAAGLKIDREARERLRGSLGGDRGASRGEIEKLALYCHGRGSVNVDDIAAVVGDVSASTVDDAVNAVLSGRLEELDEAVRRALGSGTAPFLLLSSTQRQFHALQLMRRQMESEGRSADSVVAGARPPIFFDRRRMVESALKRWDSAGITRALARLQHATLESRRNANLEGQIVRNALTAIAVESARRA